MPTVKEIIDTYIKETVQAGKIVGAPLSDSEKLAVHASIHQALHQAGQIGDLRMAINKKHDEAVVAGTRRPEEIRDIITTPVPNESVAAALIRAQTAVELDAVLKKRSSVA